MVESHEGASDVVWQPVTPAPSSTTPSEPIAWPEATAPLVPLVAPGSSAVGFVGWSQLPQTETAPRAGPVLERVEVAGDLVDLGLLVGGGGVLQGVDLGLGLPCLVLGRGPSGEGGALGLIVGGGGVGVPSSPSWRPCDYADLKRHATSDDQPIRAEVGITRTSA